MKIAIYRVGCHIYWSRWAYISQDSTATGWKGQMEIFQDFLYSAKAVTHASLAASVGWCNAKCQVASHTKGLRALHGTKAMPSGHYHRIWRGQEVPIWRWLFFADRVQWMVLFKAACLECLPTLNLKLSPMSSKKRDLCITELAGCYLKSGVIHSKCQLMKQVRAAYSWIGTTLSACGTTSACVGMGYT